MRIGIITIHNSPNYGACLQAYALWKYIEQHGCDVEIIDLYRPYQKKYIPSRKFHPLRQRRDLIYMLRQILRKILRKKHGTIGYKLFSDESKKKFDEFNSSLKYSKAYLGIDELYENPPQYDLYISGSDQVWNPIQPYCMEPYFLTFVPQGKRKISYSSSIGISELKSAEKEKFKDWLSSYDAVSVREKQAKTLLESLMPHKDIIQVCDPVFLLDVELWRKNAVYPAIKERYILLFILQWSKQLVDYAIGLSQESGLRLVVLTQIQPEEAEGRYSAVTDAGPKEFLGYISNAEMVITDSFHCTVFSIIMGANNFYTYIAPDNKRGSRIIDVYDRFGVSGHLLPVTLDARYSELSSKKINHTNIRKQMLRIQAEGRRFIDEQITRQ